MTGWGVVAVLGGGPRALIPPWWVWWERLIPGWSVLVGVCCKRPRPAPGCQAGSIKAASAQEEKDQCERTSVRSPSRAQLWQRRGTGSCNSAATEWAVRPQGPRQHKRASVPQTSSRGPGGGIKARSVPAALNVTFVFQGRVNGRLARKPAGSPPLARGLLDTQHGQVLCPRCWEFR